MSSPTSSDRLFDEILDAPDRDSFEGCERVLSYRDDDETEFLQDIDRHATARVALTRRGIWHGNLAQVPPAAAVPGPPLEAIFAQRWHTARPILLRSAFDPGAASAHLSKREQLHADLRQSGSLRRFLKAEDPALRPHFTAHPQHEALVEPERDIEQVRILWAQDPGNRTTERVKDLWARSSRLSTFAGDHSLRMRLSFGNDKVDDASRDLQRHKLVTELAEQLLPESKLIHNNARITGLLDEHCDGPTFLTQHIAYWNSPQGGALLHHDAFDEERRGGQRGVVYAQFTGRTAWLALSLEDLARRVREFAEYLAEGELPWVRSQVFGRADQFERFQKKCERFRPLMKELARPGSGFLGRLVNHGPEFTTFLADCGHAYILGPGDVLLLPNHGLDRTAMHSVFCAGGETGYALSMAVRDSELATRDDTDSGPSDRSSHE
ncbi:MAG: hypothetical protein ACI8QZ_000440 [Chlamydiales bacterium]|jgi:hypothetical protein